MTLPGAVFTKEEMGLAGEEGGGRMCVSIPGGDTETRRGGGESRRVRCGYKWVRGMGTTENRGEHYVVLKALNF